MLTNDNYINNAFLKATKLTNKVVKKMGARGHINNLYKIKKINSCTCQEFKLNIRKQIKRCNININNLEKRVINALNSNAYDNLSKINFEEINNIVFVGTGGSFAGANFASKVINDLYGVNVISLYPPKWYDGKVYKKVAPSNEILMDWKHGNQDDEAKSHYERMYSFKILRKLNV